MDTSRRRFVRSTGILGLASMMYGSRAFSLNSGKRIGIVGLDSSHSIAFTKELNANLSNDNYRAYHVVAAYPFGNPDIPLNGKRIPVLTTEIEKLGVKVVQSLSELLRLVDVVLLETNDGNLHLKQAEIIMKAGKPVFIDKPVANSYNDALSIFSLSDRYKVPVFSSSSLRYIQGLQDIDKKTVLGADIFSPAHVEPSHKDLYWYGIHGVEMLFALLGSDCISVQTTHTDDFDVYVGKWSDGRIGTLRGTRKGADEFGGTVFTDTSTIKLGAYQGYAPLLKEIVAFFDSGKSPVQREETLAICKFIDAAFESKQKNGERVLLKGIQ
ncbi:Gfo/Idh/MocA family oxidoreductase [Arcticibacter tournemirensis]|uniref:Gfo/Idh/MocA family oxidoreductase n=1 Tax=Arcticibacter tournemirensis TaxID=699437 RepID=A0A4Q0MBC1_9SPHI|nr:Gfo/Idh/MocA family oxidoreductase [Arcticibacter tournemirensis]RXF70577.1 gfo/Idh/MocA family oxidoreductase [Arcticibacter tournemirensis]